MEIFSLPEMMLLSSVIDYLITHGIEFDWVHLYNNISDAIRNGHVKVTMYEQVGKDLEQYVLHGS